jgi:hypothetical protein
MLYTSWRGNPSPRNHMRRRSQSKANPRQQAPTGRPFTAADVRLMLSSPVYANGINLLPAERVAEEVTQFNTRLAQIMRETGVTYSLADLDQRFQVLLQQLEDTGICHRGEFLSLIITKEQWLQAQLVTIQKLARGEEL